VSVGQCYQLNGKLLIDISELSFYLILDLAKSTIRTRSKKEPVPPEGSELWGTVYFDKSRDYIIESKDIRGLRVTLNLDKNTIETSLCAQGVESSDDTSGLGIEP
jgi:hypothetical protein